MDFKKTAQKSINTSLTDGKTQITTDELINSPVLTITAFDLAESKDGKAFAIVIFKEFPNFYYFGGTMLTRIVQAWISEMEFTDNREASEVLESQGGCPIRLTKQQTKNGNEFIKVEILE